MSELSADAKRKVLELKRLYISSFPDKIEQLEISWQRIQTGQFAQIDVDELRAQCHKIAGSSGSYELLDISHAAHQLELLCANAKQGGGEAGAALDLTDGFQLLMKLLQQQEMV